MQSFPSPPLFFLQRKSPPSGYLDQLEIKGSHRCTSWVYDSIGGDVTGDGIKQPFEWFLIAGRKHSCVSCATSAVHGISPPLHPSSQLKHTDTGTCCPSATGFPVTTPNKQIWVELSFNNGCRRGYCTPFVYYSP